MYKRIKQSIIISRLFAIILSVLLCFSIFSVISYAAPEDEDNDIEVEYIDLTGAEDVLNEDVEDVYGGDVEVEEIERVEGTEETKETDNIDNTKEIIATATEKNDSESNNNEQESEEDDIYQYAFTIDGKGTVKDLITDGNDIFYVIETDDGSDYFLMLQYTETEGGNQEPYYEVFFLSEVDLNDIYEYLDSSTSSSSSTSNNTEESEETEKVIVEETTSESSSSSSLIVVIIIIVIIVVVILIYRNRNKKNKKAKPSETNATDDEFMNSSNNNQEEVIDDNWDDDDGF